jgi:hypothetical protein
MRNFRATTLLFAILAILAFGPVLEAAARFQDASGLAGRLPKPAGWTMSEAPQKYLPETLFEYIDGGAESYLSYEFVELALGQYKASTGKATMTVEIYDMKTSRNAFGIYGAERYSESRFLPIGIQGYIEEGTLNFLAGRYYVKLLAFEAGADTEAALKTFAAEILKGIPEIGAFPAPVTAFPKAGLIANTEKFILRDFLGLKFLSNGFVASYKAAAGEFDAFIIEAQTPAGAQGLLKSVLDHFTQAKMAVAPTAFGSRIKDPYLANILIAGAGRFLCGVTKVKDGGEAAGEAIVRGMIKALNGLAPGPEFP